MGFLLRLLGLTAFWEVDHPVDYGVPGLGAVWYNNR